MEKIAISKFKATCLAVLERVKRTGRPVLITKFGEPVAEVVPPPPKERPEDWIGSMQSTGKITGDIVNAELGEWETIAD